jgi:hypothetical protein
MITNRRMRPGHQRGMGDEETRVACSSSVRILESEDDLRSALDRAAMFERVISRRISERLSGYETHKVMTTVPQEYRDSPRVSTQ